MKTIDDYFQVRSFAEVLDHGRAIAESLKGKPVSFGQWIVKKDGTLVSDNHMKYTIHHSRIENNLEWIRHMSEKNWVNLGDFTKAYLFALKRIGN